MAEARTMEKSELEAKNVAELQEIAGGLGIEGLKGLRKGQLIDAILEANGGAGGRTTASAEQAEADASERSGGNGGVATREAPPQTERPQREDRGPDVPFGRQLLIGEPDAVRDGLGAAVAGAVYPQLREGGGDPRSLAAAAVDLDLGERH